MKKCIAAILAVCMAAAVSLPVLAAEPESLTPPSPNTNKPDGSYSLGVTGTYVPSGSTADETISVDITWETLSFTYTAGGSTYDPSTHQTTSGGGSWSTDKPGITVTNHSNAPIEASMSFAAASGVTTTGSFYTKGEGETYTAITSAADQKLSLATAENTSGESVPKGTLYFGVSGAPISENKTLGTITVKIEKDQWTRVSTEEELHTALETGAHVKLMNDITAVGEVWVDLGDGAVLDLNGKTLNAALGIEGQCEVKNGTINSNGNPIYANDGDTVRITDCTINAGDETEGAIKVSGTLILSGRIDLQYKIVLAGGSVTCLAGTYNFDPTEYVDANTYTVTANTDGTWTVAAKTN